MTQTAQPLPASGGSYIRDPITGALTPAEGQDPAPEADALPVDPAPVSAPAEAETPAAKPRKKEG